MERPLSGRRGATRADPGTPRSVRPGPRRPTADRGETQASRRATLVGMEEVREDTIASRRRLYLLARVVVRRHYREQLTLPRVATALSSSPRQLQRSYAQFGGLSFREELRSQRLRMAADLLVEQRFITVADVARLVGYESAAHFARAFRRRYGLPPGIFRERAIHAGAQRPARAPIAGAGDAGSGSQPCPSRSRLEPSASASGRRSRISVPPPGATSAVTLPPC
jgi:AraC-like DNA-binding protein